MSIDIFLQGLLEPLGFIKAVFLVVVFIYIIFAFVMLVQVRTMNNVIHETISSTILFSLAIINLFAALSLFAYALAIL